MSSRFPTFPMRSHMSSQDRFHYNMAKAPNSERVIAFKGDSHESLAHLLDKGLVSSFDAVYVDASHDVSREMERGYHARYSSHPVPRRSLVEGGGTRKHISGCRLVPCSALVYRRLSRRLSCTILAVVWPISCAHRTLPLRSSRQIAFPLLVEYFDDGKDAHLCAQGTP